MMRFTNEEEFAEFKKGKHFREHGRDKIAEVIPDAKPKKKAKARSKIEEQLSHQIKLAGLPAPVEHPSQFRPFPARNIRVDFAWPALKLIVEVDGGAHAARERFTTSFERGFLLLLEGWKVLHVGENEVLGGLAVEWVRQLLEQRQVQGGP